MPCKPAIPLAVPTVAETLGAWIAGHTLDRTPAPVVHAAKRCLIDLAGVAVAGAATALAGLARDHAIAESAAGPCAVLGADATVTPAAAAFANAVAGHVLDFDDTGYDGIVHATAAVWPAVAALAEAEGADGVRTLTAFIAGVETEYALGRALADRSYDKGWWNSGLLGAIGAAAGSARLLGLDAGRTATAVAAAACQAAGPRVVLGSPLKPWGLGLAAQTGVRAAGLARLGLTAPVDAFENPHGFLALVNDGVFVAGRLSQLGQRFSLVDPGIAVKLYPVCSAAQAAAEAVARLLAEAGLTGERVVGVEAVVTPLVGRCLVHDRPGGVAEAQFSLPFAVGCILAFGRLGIGELDPAVLADPRLAAAMARVVMVPSATLVADGDRSRFPEAARVTVTLDDGRVLRRFHGAATGMPVNPMPDADLEAKYWACVDGRLPAPAAQAWLDRLWTLESQPRLAGPYPGPAGPDPTVNPS